MRVTSPRFATAASIAALLIAIPAAMTVLRDPGDTSPQVTDNKAPPPAQLANGPVREPASPIRRTESMAAQAPAEPSTFGDDKAIVEAAKQTAPLTTGDADSGILEIGVARDDADKGALFSGKGGAAAEAKPTDAAKPAPVASYDALNSGAVDLGGASNLAESERGRLQERGRIASITEADERQLSAVMPGATTERHPDITDNPVKQVAAEPVSTFSIDVDTASYSFTRRMLNAGQLPQPDAVRVEELINYFPYSYPAPETRDVPFQPTATILPAPWNSTHKLVHIGIKGYSLQSAERPRANLVFLIDVSGSMEGPDRLDLVKNGFRLLLDQLKPDDTVGIVTYAGDSGIALEPTKAADKSKILAAIDGLGAGGSTAGAEGIVDAYRLAEAHFDPKGVNRIILATDGDFNVGLSDTEALKGLIERKRQSGVFLSILGVGQDNYNDTLMQALAQNGNGTAAYVDTLNEARKVLVDEASSSLFTIAKDVKIQVEFNPAMVSEYRLIGYETRGLKREDFNNDRVDAGEIGSGHTVTALYEITPVGAVAAADPLRYGPATTAATNEAPRPSGEYGFVKLRYKLPNEEASKLIALPLTPALERPSLSSASDDVRFATAVAGFGQLLRGSSYLGGFGFDDVITLAQTAKGEDPFGYRAEFVNLVRLAKSARP